MSETRKTITHFILEEQRRVGGSGIFTSLLHEIITACKMISSQVGRGALVGTHGNLETQNVQGETQKMLDVISNEVFLHENEMSGNFAAMASEEMDDVYQIPSKYPKGNYLLVFDPLDGSSNVGVNVSVGTIFSILRCPAGVTEPTKEDFLQPGTEQVCAGYALYGSSTTLVLSTGRGVNGFTLDRNIGSFVLTHPNMRVPEDTKEYAINSSRSRFWEPPVKRYVDEVQMGKDGPNGVNYTLRWVASMVADVHRILSRGGVFMYPMDSDNKSKGGKLRLLYEANPMAFLVEQAGGMAITGRQRIMEVQPTGLHQRISVMLGSKNDIEKILRYHQEYDAQNAAQ